MWLKFSHKLNLNLAFKKSIDVKKFKRRINLSFDSDRLNKIKKIKALEYQGRR